METIVDMAPPRYVAPLAGTSFLVLTAVVVVHGGLPGDRAVLRRTASADALAGVAQVVDRLTDHDVVAAAAVILVVTLLRLRRRYDAAVVVVVVAAAVGGTTLMKELVDRPRPDRMPASADVSPLSFPSGHATSTAALVLLVVLLSLRTRRASAVAAAGAGLVGVAAAAQLVLARHHPSDILGGWLWATTCASAVWSLRPTRRGGAAPEPEH